MGLAIHAAGLPIRRIASLLGHERKAVRRWLRAGCAPSWRKPPRPRLLDPYRPYLEQRWREGVRNAALLWRELRDQGFQGGSSMIRHWASKRRDAKLGVTTFAPSAPARPAGKTPSSRRAARLMTADTATLSEAEQRFVSILAAQSPDIANVAASQGGSLPSSENVVAVMISNHGWPKPRVRRCGPSPNQRSTPRPASSARGSVPALEYQSGRRTDQSAQDA